MGLHEDIDAFFAATGPLSSLLPGYAPRAPQIDMAHVVADAMTTKRGRAVVEAGTGTGKSLAYLAAALCAGKRVVVTTGTKALQEQLYTKDVPLALRAMELLDREGERIPDVDTVLVKGRQNYLCKLRWERFSAQPMFAFAGDAGHYPALMRFAASTKTGDRAEVAGLPDSFSTWAELDANSEACIGKRCPSYDACFVVQMRRRADGARLVVANHHLLCADLRLRLETASTRNGDGDGGAPLASVLPTPDVFVIDEAHQLPDIASEYFGVNVSTLGVERLCGELKKLADGWSGDARAEALDAADLLADRGLTLLAEVRARSDDERAVLALDGEGAVRATELHKALCASRDRIKALPDAVLGGAVDGAMQNAERDNFARRLDALASEVKFVFQDAPEDKRFVVIATPSKRGVSVQATPVDVAAALGGTLFQSDVPVVMTSATLAVAKDTSAFCARIGLPSTSAVSRVLPSPFDFARRAALYAPQGMPEPDKPGYAERYLDEVRFLLELCGGGALVLFTSHAAMQRAGPDVIAHAKRLGLPAFLQGDRPKQELLDELRRHHGERGAVLCATHSFWEGIDVRGRALRLVVIDRLPFKVPTDPLRKARHQLVEERGGDAFAELSLPEAALSLKQGAGRLLRDVDDAGVVAILDGRLRKRRYGNVFLDTLPPMTRVGGRAPLVDFWRRFVAPSLGLTPPPEPARA